MTGAPEGSTEIISFFLVLFITLRIHFLSETLGIYCMKSRLSRDMFVGVNSSPIAWFVRMYVRIIHEL